MNAQKTVILSLLINFLTFSVVAQNSVAYSSNRTTSTSKKYSYNSSIKRIKTSSREEKVDYTVWKSLLQKNVQANGKVNYKGFKEDVAKLNKFLRILSSTKITGTWTKNDKIAYWINVYNAYTVKLVLNKYPINSIKEISGPWKKKFFPINGVLMSLGQVEHDILRDFGEPRIHFAINCASRSCPRLIQIPYTAENLSKLLDRQTKEFINDEFYNTITEYTVHVSHIFDWYKKDFKVTHGSVTNFINQYSNVTISNQKSKGYKPYDWSLNQQK